jgi:hypothetical protein
MKPVRRNRERVKGNSRANAALVARNNKQKIADLIISIISSRQKAPQVP